jgi:hypothetical protein
LSTALSTYNPQVIHKRYARVFPTVAPSPGKRADPRAGGRRAAFPGFRAAKNGLWTNKHFASIYVLASLPSCFSGPGLVEFYPCLFTESFSARFSAKILTPFWELSKNAALQTLRFLVKWVPFFFV